MTIVTILFKWDVGFSLIGIVIGFHQPLSVKYKVVIHQKKEKKNYELAITNNSDEMDKYLEKFNTAYRKLQ